MESEVRLGGGRYVRGALLGEGAQGVTYAAIDRETQRPVAIKRFDVRGARSWKDVELAERETRVLATLDHPLVPSYIAHFEEDGALFLVMEKVEGETLDAICRREGALPETEVRRFLASADRVLTYLHGRGAPVVHRDVKPRNVVRRPDGAYVLVDFGAVSERLVRKGSSTVVGTMGYMAPEQLQGRALPATDVYAVGATALAALTGVEPETLPHQGLRVDVAAALAGRASPALIACLERMLEPDPDRRARSVGEALEGLHASAPAPVVSARPGPPSGMAPTFIEASDEHAVAKSLRKLLWLLWGLGWVLVPLLLRPFHAQQLIPLVMFGSLAALFVVTWHKNALLRAGLRAWNARVVGTVPAAGAGTAAVADAGSSGAARQRVEVPPDGAARVRVRTSDLSHEETLNDTDVGSSDAAPRRRRR